MPYLIICRANTDITAMRRRLRAIHLEYILKYRDRIRFGGPIMSANPERMVGMLTVLDVPDRSDAEQFVRDEPYCQAGLFDEITIDPWLQRIPEPEPNFLDRELERERARLQGES